MERLNLTALQNGRKNQKAIATEICNDAEKIISTRKRNAKVVGLAVDQIRNSKNSVNTILDVIESKVDGISVNACSKEKREAIQLYCATIRKSYNEYYKDASELAVRFDPDHSRIKVIAYGAPGQGKSSFVKLFTGLPDEIVAEHRKGESEDKTGAMNVYYWDPQHKGDPTVEVVFKTKEEFLKQFLDNLEVLNITKVNNIDIYQIQVSDIESWIGSKNIEFFVDGKTVSLKNLSGDMGATSMISHIFEKETRLDELADAPNTKVSKKVEEIPIYNDMTNKKVRKWVTVNKIIVTISGSKQDYLKYFEVRDTKGISVQAGGENAENDVFNQLAVCDAAFSIAQPGGSNTNSLDFYNNKVRGFCKDHQTFKNRHFVICNLHKGTNHSYADIFMDKIESGEITGTCYDGMLIDDIEKKHDARKFVNLLMLDMLRKIVRVVGDEDNRLIEECNKNVSTICEAIENLNNEIESLGIKPVNVDDIIKKKIADFKEKADEEIIKKCFGGNNPLHKNVDSSTFQKDFDDDDDDNSVIQSEGTKGNTYSDSLYVEYTDEMYRKVLEDKQTPSIFQLLTNNKGDDKHRNDSVSEAVESAINVIWNEIEQTERKSECNKENFGNFVDERVLAINEKLQKNTKCKVEDTISKQSKEGITDMFKIIWNQFKLDKLVGEFSEDLFEELAKENIIINTWFDIYTEKRDDNKIPSFTWCRSYDILQEYFKGGVNKIDLRKGNFLNVIDIERLKKAIINSIDLGQVVRHIINQSYFVKLNTIYTSVFKDIHQNFVILAMPKKLEELLPLYTDRLGECVQFKIIEDYNSQIIDSEKYEETKHQCMLLVQKKREVPTIEINK